ncbi:MAG: hypothetical protein IPI45_00070 [Saprospiraceae bacterium]|nr:hypothetical protein [Saprospiraceae bacterium]MBK7912485.1 hypothetical protein [Saprospiraceae bacterium]
MDKTIVHLYTHDRQIQNLVLLVNRLSLFVVFFWFGLLKVLGLSPAEALVTHLHNETIGNLLSASNFCLILGIVECTIGVLWLFPKLTKFAFFLFSAQMCTTFLPLFYLPGDTWQNGFALTLTGQYIIKNVVLVASAMTILFYHRNQSAL